MTPPRFEFLMGLAVDVGDVVSMGPAPLGDRRVVSQGYRHGPAEVLAALARGEAVDPATYFFRTIMRFETGAPYLESLNKTIAVAKRRGRQGKFFLRRTSYCETAHREGTPMTTAS